MKLSVIIPVYNSEKYLKQCIDSVLDTQEREIEVIAINDGSTDSSLHILESYGDKRLKIIDKPNEGVFKTWQLGVRMATGDYLAFVDSDDYILPSYYGVIFSTLNKRAYDMVVFKYGLFTQMTRNVVQRLNVAQGEYEGEELEKLRESFAPFYEGGSMSAFRWNKIFKSEILKSFFQDPMPDVNYFEDACVVYPVLMQIKSLCVLDDVLYDYRLRSDSITHDATKLSANLENCRKANAFLSENALKYNLSQSKLDNLYFATHMEIYHTAIKSKKYKFASQMRKDKKLAEMIKTYDYKSAIKGFLLKHNMLRTYRLLAGIRSRVHS